MSAIRAGRAFVEVGADDAPLSVALRRAQAKLAAFGQAITQLGGGMVAMGGGALGALAWPLTLAANMETTRAAFNAMLKDMNATNRLMAELQKFAASTPFEFPELADAARKLLAFGVSAGEMTDTLRAVGDVAAAIDAPLGEIAEIYGKARVQGRLFMEDINQLTGRGIPVIGQLAKQFGVTEDKVRALVETGKVSFANLQRAFVDLTTGAGDFAGMMDAKSKTLWGQWSTLKDTIAAAVMPIGEALLPAVVKIVGALSNVAAVMGKFLERYADIAVYVAAGSAAFVTLGSVLAVVGISLTGFVGLLSFAASVFGAMLSAITAVAGVIGSVLAPIGIGGTAAIVTIGLLAKEFGLVSQAVNAAGGALQSFANAFTGLDSTAMIVSSTFKSVFQTILDGWRGVVNSLAAGDAAAALEVTSAGMQLAWLQLTSGMVDAWHDLTGSIFDAWTDLVTNITKAGVNLVTNVLTAWNYLTGTMQTVLETAAFNIVGALDLIGTRIGQLMKYWGRFFGMTEQQANDLSARLEKEYQDRAAGRQAGADALGRKRTGARDQAIEELQSKAAEYFNELDAIAELEKESRQRGIDEAEVTAEQRMNAAREKFSELNKGAEYAARDAAEARKNDLTKAAAAAVSQAEKLGSGGTFNAAAVRSLGAGTVADRTAKATERTAKAAEGLLDRADKGNGMVFA